MRRKPNEQRRDYRPGRPMKSVSEIIFGTDPELKKSLELAIKNLPTDGNLEFQFPGLSELQQEIRDE
jgi:hypothetical protein